MRPLGVKPDGENVEQILESPASGLRTGKLRTQPELLVVRDLDVHLRAEPILKPATHVEVDQVGRMHRPRGSSAGIEKERMSALLFVEDPPQVPVAVVDPSGQEWRQRAMGRTFEPLEQLRRQGLGPELLPESVVVDVALHLVRGDDELLGARHFDDAP